MIQIVFVHPYNQNGRLMREKRISNLSVEFNQPSPFCSLSLALVLPTESATND